MYASNGSSRISNRELKGRAISSHKQSPDICISNRELKVTVADALSDTLTV